MSARVFVDTNVLVYLFDESEPKKKALAAQALEREGDTSELVVSTQVLQELYVSLTWGRRPLVSQEHARATVQAAGEYTTVQVDTELVLAAIDLGQRASLSFWDALIVAAAVRAGCDRILTEDLNEGQVIEGVRVDNPLKPSA